MEKNAPLTELLRIASVNLILAKKIAEIFPVELIDYEIIIKEKVFYDPNRDIVSNLLIDRLDPNVFDIRRLIKLRKKVDYSKATLVNRLIDKFPDQLIDADIIFLLLRSENEDDQAFGFKLSSRLQKSRLNLILLLQLSKSKQQLYSLVAKTLIAKYFISELGFKALLEYSEEDDEYIKSEAMKELLSNHQDKITYLDCVRFQSVKDKAIRNWARGIADAEPEQNLNYIKLLDIYSKASIDSEKAVRELISTLLKKIGSDKFNVPTLFNIMKYADNATTVCINSILFEIAENKEIILLIDEIMPFFSFERKNVSSAARQMLVDHFPDSEKLTFELLDLFYDEADQKVKQKVARIMLKRFPENLGIKILIMFLGLQDKDVSEKALALIEKISQESIDLLEIIELLNFEKTSYDLGPIRDFASQYLFSLPKEAVRKEEKRLSWYIKNGKDRGVIEVIEKLQKHCLTDYDAKVKEFFSKHEINL